MKMTAMMSKTIVTGVAGFIGSQLAQMLLKSGFEVTGIDSFEDYYPTWIKERNLLNLKQDHNFKLIHANLLALDLKPLVQDMDYIFHQAAQSGVRDSFGHSFALYVSNNVVATQKLLEAVKDTRIKKFVFASSSSVYGNTPFMPVKEDSILMPYSPYGVTKMAAEQLVKVYHRNFGVPTVSLRYFTVYGPGQRPDMAFHKFIKAVLENRKIEVYGDGSQTRDFTFITDIVKATMLAIHAPDGMVFNIGGGTRVGLMDVIKTIGEQAGRKVDVVFAPVQKGDVKDTSADVQLAQEVLGYRPEVTLEEGLKHELQYIKGLYSL